MNWDEMMYNLWVAYHNWETTRSTIYVDEITQIRQQMKEYLKGE